MSTVSRQNGTSLLWASRSTVDSAYSGHNIRWLLYPTVFLLFGHDFSGHYNRLALISMDILSGVYCITATCHVGVANERKGGDAISDGHRVFNHPSCIPGACKGHKGR